MVKLPKRIHNVIDGLLKDLRARESTSSIGLFGSWSRGDATVNSDVDLLIVDSRDFDYEYIERIELDEVFFDLDHVPERWLLKGVPSEIDQKLYEAQILYDKNWLLTNTKEWMAKTYWRPERVEIRTENYLIEADTYLSRATSASNKGDLQSASVYTTVGLESILKTLIEINMLPISNSHFIEALRDSAQKLGMGEFYEDYLRISGLAGVDQEDAEERLGAFEAVWNEAITTINERSSVLEELHVNVRNKLNYYGKPSFLRGMALRTRSLIDSGLFVEASHYLLRTMVGMLESYGWLGASIEGVRFDYTTLFNFLKGKRETPTEIYKNSTRAIGIEELKKEAVEESLKRAREITLNIRRRRKGLIRERVKPT